MYRSIIFVLFFLISISLYSRTINNIKVCDSTNLHNHNIDSVPCIVLEEFVKNGYSCDKCCEKEAARYLKLVRDIKKTLPYAKKISSIIIETYQCMGTLPDDKEKEKYLKQIEKYLKEEYTPKMKQLTRSQGQLLIKLIDRQTNSSSYEIVKAFMGSFKAWGYNFFASLFGNSLKKRYDPQKKDKEIEEIIIQIEKNNI